MPLPLRPHSHLVAKLCYDRATWKRDAMRVVMANARAELSLGFKLPPNMASMSREEARAAVQAASARPLLLRLRLAISGSKSISKCLRIWKAIAEATVNEINNLGGKPSGKLGGLAGGLRNE
jgi:hypothetical protein